MKGKTRDQIVAVTCTDHGEPGRRDVVREHYSFAAACRAYQGLWDTYHRLPAQRGDRPLARVWIEWVQPEGGTMARGTGRVED